MVHKGKPAVKQTQQIILQENEIQVVQVRSMPNLNKVAVAPTVPGEVPAEPSQPEELETKTKSKSVAQTEQ